MIKKDFLYLALLIAFYLVLLTILKPQIFKYRFSQNLINRYFCSQDIPHEPPCIRLFLSDGDIHIAAGVLYARGIEPTSYNFQHPPFIKYLYGYSVLFLGNPYYVQIMFGVIYIFLTYFLGKKIFKHSEVSFLAGLLLLADPLFLTISSNTLLDLGQAVFLLLYFLTIVFYKDNFLSQGVSLGLLFASKFWGGSLFFVLLLTLYIIYKRQFKLKKYIYHLAIAFIVFSAVYTKTFISDGGRFNILFFELKTFKYWLNHSVASIFGSSLFLFLTGYLKSWWESKSMVKGDVWTPIWPISLIVSSIIGLKSLIKRTINLQLFVNLIPIFYLIYLGVQAPFTRYFILILPFAYLSLSSYVTTFIKKKSR